MRHADANSAASMLDRTREGQKKRGKDRGCHFSKDGLKMLISLLIFHT